MTRLDDKVLLDHSSLDALTADLDRRRDSRLRFRNVETGVFGPPWKLQKVETDGQTMRLWLESELFAGQVFTVYGDYRILNLKFMGGIVGQPPLYPPTGEFRTEDGTALQVWADGLPQSPGADADDSLRRRRDENLRSIFG